MKKRFYLPAVIFTAFLLVLSACSKDDDDNGKNGKNGDPEPLTPREQAIHDYKTMYLASAMSDPGFTGTLAGCDAGAVSQESHDNVVLRINYFRKLVGLNYDLVLNASQNDMCQEASLYMIANNTLTHYPSPSGQCYTQGAYDAASQGNIAISWGHPGNSANHSVNAVTGYIEDPGDHNKPVGHRAWLLQPELSRIGHGSVWFTDGNRAANCLMWGDNITGSPSSLEFVAYPPNGYMPGPLVFPRWSFSIPGATFGSAEVSMTGPSGNVNLQIVHRSTSSGGMPDPRIVWEPQGIVTSGNNDIVYSVTVSNITGAPKDSYTYEVTIIPGMQLARYGIPMESDTEKEEIAPGAFRKILAK